MEGELEVRLVLAGRERYDFSPGFSDALSLLIGEGIQVTNDDLGIDASSPGVAGTSVDSDDQVVVSHERLFTLWLVESAVGKDNDSQVYLPLLAHHRWQRES